MIRITEYDWEYISQFLTYPDGRTLKQVIEERDQKIKEIDNTIKKAIIMLHQAPHSLSIETLAAALQREPSYIQSVIDEYYEQA